MSDIIKMDYRLIADMIRTFSRGQARLEETRQEMESIALELDDGALLGRGGSTLSDALRTKLNPSITRLHDKFHELAADVQQAMDEMQAADQSSKGMF